MLKKTPIDISVYDSSIDTTKVVHQDIIVNGSAIFERTLITNENKKIPVEISSHKFAYRGKPTVLSIARDITERKQVEIKIQKDLKEKNVLLKEIHHRVKNNLQIISSLLYLQSQRINDDRLERLYADSQNRIKSMALIHEVLYRSENFAQIDFERYIQSLTSHLLSTYTGLSSNIELKINVKDVALTIETAIPCGLIINELVSNSLKYAFPEKKGRISIELKSNGSCERGEEYLLRISDNGIGLPDHFNLQKSDTLGMQLVTNLTEQLNGTIELNSNGKTTFTIRFSVNK
jgi:two-component sensor histidine kinase